MPSLGKALACASQPLGSGAFYCEAYGYSANRVFMDEGKSVIGQLHSGPSRDAAKTSVV